MLMFPLAAASVAGGGDLVWLAYVLFLLLVLAFLALDLGVFHRDAHEVSMKEAATWSVIWVTAGLLFSAFVYFAYEHHWLGIGTRPDPVDGVVNNGAAAAVTDHR